MLLLEHQKRNLRDGIQTVIEIMRIYLQERNTGKNYLGGGFVANFYVTADAIFGQESKIALVKNDSSAIVLSQIPPMLKIC